MKHDEIVELKTHKRNLLLKQIDYEKIARKFAGLVKDVENQISEGCEHDPDQIEIVDYGYDLSFSKIRMRRCNDCGKVFERWKKGSKFDIEIGVPDGELGSI